MLQFNVRTVLHGIVLLSVHMFPIIMIASILYAQHNSCIDEGVGDLCFLQGLTYFIAVAAFCFLILIQMLYSTYLYLLWKNR